MLPSAYGYKNLKERNNSMSTRIMLSKFGQEEDVEALFQLKTNITVSKYITVICEALHFVNFTLSCPMTNKI